MHQNTVMNNLIRSEMLKGTTIAKGLFVNADWKHFYVGISSARRRFAHRPSGRMVTLVVATSSDPASIGPASALLAMSSDWRPGPSLQGIQTFVNGTVRLLKQDVSIVKEDNLDKRWEDLTGEIVDEVIFLSKHTAISNRPALTVHPIGVPHLQSYEECTAGGRPGWAAPPCPRLGPWLRYLKTVAKNQNLTPEFEVTLEATHHGPEVNKPAIFVEIGSTEEYWKRQDAAQTIALVVWRGLGLDGGSGVGNWTKAEEGKKVLVGIGGGHYAPRHMDIVLKEGVWVGHLLSGYSLPMEEPSSTKGTVDVNDIGGTWKEAIRVAVATTQTAFPGGEILAHIDHKSFKSWQRNAICQFLSQENIQIGKPNDFL